MINHTYTKKSYFNPFSRDHSALKEFGELKTRQRFLVVISAIFASILPVLGTCAMFRKVTHHFHEKNLNYKKTAEIANDFFNGNHRNNIVSKNLIIFNSGLAKSALEKVGRFNFYFMGLTDALIKEVGQIILTGVSLRPANFLFESLGIATTLPGSGKIFKIEDIPAAKQKLTNAARSRPDEVITVSAKGKKVDLWNREGCKKKDVNAEDVYGTNEFKISNKEIKAILDSQKIYLAPGMPRQFYFGLKNALNEGQISEFPWSEAENYTIERLISLKESDYRPSVEIKEWKYPTKLVEFLQKANTDPESFGMTNDQWQVLKQLTVYEIGALVVKSENYHVMADGTGKIVSRNVGDQDAFRLINTCGIRGFHGRAALHGRPNSGPLWDAHKKLMKNTFGAIFKAAEGGVLIVPAIGMGVWGGDPEIYWTAFFEALKETNIQFSKIYVNPGHQKTSYGKHQGCTGDEFERYLQEYKKNQPNLRNLEMIENLYTTGQDVVQLARNLKLAMPDETVSLVNASDPDVTLGNHVGEYVNHLPHTHTTEENYTALGTNGLCNEAMTGVLEDPKRIISA